MKKYAKIINEETKLCEVGLGDADKKFSETYVPPETHEEIIPAEYDDDGNVLKEEEKITVVDKEGYTKITTVGDYYKSIGMEEMDVEQAYDSSWYVEGYAPQPSVDYQNEQIRKQRQERYVTESDPIRLNYDEALARGESSAEQLKQDWLASKDKIREDLPYVEGEE